MGLCSWRTTTGLLRVVERPTTLVNTAIIIIMKPLASITCFRLLTAVCLITSLLGGVSTNAAEEKRDIVTILTGTRLKSLTEKLTLTDEQKEKMRPLISEEVKFIHGLRENQDLTEEQRVSKEKAFRDISRPKYKAILSDDQFEKFEKMRTPKPKKEAKPAAK